MEIIEKSKIYLENLPIRNEYDTIVVIPTLNEEKTIRNVVNTIDKGLIKYNLNGLIIVSDGGSKDNTLSILSKTRTFNDSIVIVDPNNGGKGGALKDAFEISKNIDFVSLITIDGDMISINENWIYKLSFPIFGGWDIVNAFYLRGKCDAIITRNIIYPINYAYYNFPIKEPLAGERGYSKKFIDKIDLDDVPNDYGIDIYLIMEGYKNGLSIYETNLGKRIHSSAEKYNDFSYRIKGMFFDVIKSFSDIMYKVHPRNGIKIYSEDIKSYEIDFDSKLDIDKLRSELLHHSHEMYVYGIDDEKWVEVLSEYISKSLNNEVDERWIEEFYYKWIGRLVYNCRLYETMTLHDIYYHIDSIANKLKENIVNIVLSGPGGI